jgi:hypothetical protein
MAGGMPLPLGRHEPSFTTFPKRPGPAECRFEATLYDMRPQQAYGHCRVFRSRTLKRVPLLFVVTCESRQHKTET